MATIDSLTRELEKITHKIESKDEQARQPLAAKLHTDPVAWGEQLGITWDWWQLEILEKLVDSQNDHTPLRVCIPASRQIGKDFCLAACLLFHAETTPSAVCLSIGPSLRQSSLLMRRVYQFYHAQGASAPKAVSEQQTQLKLSNGSYILSLPSSEQTVRGVSSVSLLILNECASLEKSLIYALTPMLSTVPDSRLFAAGTPRGKSGFFWETCMNAPANGWIKYEIKATDCARITPEWLSEEKARLGPFFDREYMVSWGSVGGGSIFRPESLARCLTDGPTLDDLLGPIVDEKNYDSDYSEDDGEEFTDIDELGLSNGWEENE